MRVRGMASTHLVKYLVLVLMNLRPLDNEECIFLTRSRPHCEKGHGEVMGCNALDGTCIKYTCC